MTKGERGAFVVALLIGGGIFTEGLRLHSIVKADAAKVVRACTDAVTSQGYANCLQAHSNDIGWWGIVIGLISIAAIAFGFWQNRQTQLIEYRAFLALTDARAHFTRDRNVVVEFDLTNYGRTPASNVQIDTVIYIRWPEVLVPGGSTSTPYCLKINRSRAHCGAALPMSDTTEAELEHADVNGVEQGVAFMLVQSRVTYIDEFGVNRSDSFFFVFSQLHDAGFTCSPLKPIHEYDDWPGRRE